MSQILRDKSQITSLQQHILPRIISNHQHDRQIRIWSAGCASGEEPYTLAMLLSELIVDLDQWDITILATDIDKAVLEKARRHRQQAIRLALQLDPDATLFGSDDLTARTLLTMLKTVTLF